MNEMMHLTVAVMLPRKINFPDTARLYVEVRDVSLIDAPSVTLCAKVSSVKASEEGGVQQILNFDVPSGEKRRSLTVWGHLSLNGNKKIEQGDFLTTQAYPVRQGVTDEHIAINLQKI